ncbi:MAG: 8-amino-7-oxononanoate synthase [Reichenbachiella sp.]
MNRKFINKLQEREDNGNLRLLSQPKDLIDFVSNDYLGLGRSKALFEKINDYSYQGITNLNGSTGSRLLAGNNEHIEQLELKLAKIFNTEACLIFNSGYVANLALISSIAQRNDTIIYDNLAHVCIKEGAALSPAKKHSFKHNDVEDLEKKLKNASGNKFVVIESIYSMDGNKAHFEDIIAVCKIYDAEIIVDEAHSTGLYGDKGAGIIESLGLNNNFIARVMTFGKAMGVHGACVVGSKELIDYLINFARPFIYTTSLPMHSIFSIDAAFEFIALHPQLQTESQDNIAYFNSYFSEKINRDSCQKLKSDTPIQPVIIGENQKAKHLALELQSVGYDVRPILSPTVPEGTERLRISIHTHNSKSEIKNLIDVLSSRL